MVRLRSSTEIVNRKSRVRDVMALRRSQNRKSKIQYFDFAQQPSKSRIVNRKS